MIKYKPIKLWVHMGCTYHVHKGFEEPTMGPTKMIQTAHYFEFLFLWSGKKSTKSNIGKNFVWGQNYLTSQFRPYAFEKILTHTD